MLSKALGFLGRTFIIVGLFILGFVAFQLWGTGIEESRNQSDLTSELASTVRSSPQVKADVSVDADAGQLAEALGKARSRSGDANSRARLLIAETDRIAKAVDIDQSMVVSDAHGRRYARLTRSGSQLVLRFQPGLDPDVLQELARRVPELYEEIARLD